MAAFWRARDKTSFNDFAESLMELSVYVGVCICACVRACPCQCPLNNNRHMEITLINKHVANKKIIMNLACSAEVS